MPLDTDLPLEEYRALRATIRERGTMRLFVAAITFVAWGALAIAAAGLGLDTLADLIPLLVLAAGFESVFAAHVGVERIGRYLQVHYESGPGQLPAWERAAMGIGRPARSATGIDPLYSTLFIAAAVVNVGPSLLYAWGADAADLTSPLELISSLALHAIFIGRVLGARRYAARQRSRDLQWFREGQQAPGSRS